MPSPTVRDVAAAAQVSISTVSRALSKPDLVAVDTREHVRRVARELGYRPAAVDPGPTVRPGAIGLIVPDLENPFFGLMAKGVQARARAEGLLVVVADVEEDAMIERTMLETVADGVDGLILCSPRAGDETIRAVAARVPTVLANRQVDDLPSVVFDEEHGMVSALRHLVALGHRRIAYAGGPSVSWTHRRRADAAHRFGEQTEDVDLIDLGSFLPYLRGGQGAADQAIASGVTAVVAFNDLLALGIIDRLIQRGVRVPTDMSIGGIDNVAASTYVRPHLTTVDASRARMGRTAVDLLVGALDSDRAPLPQILPTELIVRDSTAVAPSAHAAPVPAEHTATTAVAPTPLAR
ncbi:LacI family DNA-binding transcriptional regulator [Brachybacterium fresconis]|uniref:DNA-binding LacI/PurR family transcriptional regulator n=1 Tax=Brachybacterium fresconis TaxID=173363 RepID=A0ABS4YI55_9MICO|nr:LacI family DNA-binding transcriptional regulator [Brachybacterium fresconis]MBP2408424.1 DNA-binding LacI/PurR family transcriptional regulator [Brachybacterium fresconis]